jgi:hypothetical protein
MIATGETELVFGESEDERGDCASRKTEVNHENCCVE